MGDEPVQTKDFAGTRWVVPGGWIYEFIAQTTSYHHDPATGAAAQHDEQTCHYVFVPQPSALAALKEAK